MQILRVLIMKEGEWFVALALEQDVAAQAQSVFVALKELGDMFDIRDAIPEAVSPPAAPQEYVAQWEAGADLGEHELGKSRRARVRLALEAAGR